LSPGGKILRVSSLPNGLTSGHPGRRRRRRHGAAGAPTKGCTWYRQTLAGAPDLRAVTVGASSSHFIAVGSGGVIVRSHQFGSRLDAARQSPVIERPATRWPSMRRTASSPVGAAGTVLRSIGGAERTWQQQSFPVPQDAAWCALSDGTAFYDPSATPRSSRAAPMASRGSRSR
jgi:hypothetical protein